MVQNVLYAQMADMVQAESLTFHVDYDCSFTCLVE